MSQESLKDKVIGKLQKEYIGIEKRTDITDDEKVTRIEPARLRYALINNMNELIDAVYSSNCNGDECIAKFYPIAYDECMKDFKDFAHTQGLSWE